MGNNVLTISYDEATGIVRTVAQGATPAAEVTRYLAQLQCCARRARSGKGRLLHLVDASASAVQPRDSFDILAQAARDHGQPDDLTAVVMRSQLARMQIALLSTDVSICLFSDIAEAEAWLIAESRPATVRASN